jgi:L-lactate dehydrogenase complex protein LldF
MLSPIQPDVLERDLRARSRRALDDQFLRGAVRFTVERLRTAKGRSTEALGNWEVWRERGREIRAHTLENLDFYLEQFTTRALEAGTRVHFAKDAAEARAALLGIVREKSARRIVKSKSMLSEEIGVNEALARAGAEVVETDLGEWIVQLAQETPSHLILPAIHKQRRQIQELFEARAGKSLSPDTATLAGFAREQLRAEFAQADLGITGCNFAVAETGSVVLFTNEGNGRMVTTLPRAHVVVMGMERIVPTLDDLEVMANLLPRSATGQKITAYMNVVTGPRRAHEADGASELHVIVVDNGRSGILRDSQFRDVLSCIRCGACLNVCPVYRQVGGHAYGSVYSGPIGAVLGPLLDPAGPSAELANASTLCGACFEACPVKIPLHDHLVQLRRRNVEAGRVSLPERASFAAFAWVFSSASWFRSLGRFARGLQRLLGQHTVERLASLLPALAGWTSRRALPRPAKKAFRDSFEERSS